jgi:drug/metabolite transporter superfamily protein YnfA
MTLALSLLILVVAALLEAGGDAIIRNGLKAPTSFSRMAFFVVGAFVLFAYGYVVNVPSWDFGRLLGVYVVFFFLAAQLISLFVFHTRPSLSTIIGGACIVLGGIIISIGSLK